MYVWTALLSSAHTHTHTFKMLCKLIIFSPVEISQAWIVLIVIVSLSIFIVADCVSFTWRWIYRDLQRRPTVTTSLTCFNIQIICGGKPIEEICYKNTETLVHMHSAFRYEDISPWGELKHKELTIKKYTHTHKLSENILCCYRNNMKFYTALASSANIYIISIYVEKQANEPLSIEWIQLVYKWFSPHAFAIISTFCKIFLFLRLPYVASFFVCVCLKYRRLFQKFFSFNWISFGFVQPIFRSLLLSMAFTILFSLASTKYSHIDVNFAYYSVRLTFLFAVEVIDVHLLDDMIGQSLYLDLFRNSIGHGMVLVM